MTGITRKSVGAVLAAMACWASTAVHAQSGPGPAGYPNKPVRLMIGLPVGGAVDVFMRDLGQRLGPKWGQPIVADNRPGSGSILAVDAVMKAAPDGYTLLAGTNAIVTNMILGKVNYDVRKVLAPIIKLTSQPYVLITNKSVPANSVKDLLALAKSKPGGLNYASSGVGAASHLGMELLSFMAGGVNLVHVPYKGVAQGVNDMLAGRVDMMFSITITALPLIKSEKVKVIAVTTAQRSGALPDVPTLSESGLPGFSLSTDYSLLAPAGTPPAILDFINRSAAQIMQTPEVRANIEKHGSDAAPPNSPAEFRKLIDQDIVILEKFVKASGFKGE
jgi:tripartite-type tricarboxylate transporter receptor subunit TctC